MTPPSRWTRRATTRARPASNDLAAQVRTALGGTAPTSVTVDGIVYSGPVYGPGWDDDIPTGGYGGAVTALMTDGARKDPGAASGGAERVAEPDLAAGRAFARLLGVPTSAVKRGSAAGPGHRRRRHPAARHRAGRGAVPAADPAGRHHDQRERQHARRGARPPGRAGPQPAGARSTAPPPRWTRRWPTLGLPADEITLSDGSGLSRRNRISPSLLTDLIRLAASPDHPELAGVFGGLPVGGWSGTLDDRYRTAPGTAAGAGVVRAKTGTLTGVHAIAGLVTTADGRLLTFAVLTDKVPGGTDTAQPALDRIAAALAGCGCR